MGKNPTQDKKKDRKRGHRRKTEKVWYKRWVGQLEQVVFGVWIWTIINNVKCEGVPESGEQSGWRLLYSIVWGGNGEWRKQSWWRMIWKVWMFLLDVRLRGAAGGQGQCGGGVLPPLCSLLTTVGVAEPLLSVDVCIYLKKPWKGSPVWWNIVFTFCIFKLILFHLLWSCGYLKVLRSIWSSLCVCVYECSFRLC